MASTATTPDGGTQKTLTSVDVLAGAPVVTAPAGVPVSVIVRAMATWVNAPALRCSQLVNVPSSAQSSSEVQAQSALVPAHGGVLNRSGFGSAHWPQKTWVCFALSVADMLAVPEVSANPIGSAAIIDPGGGQSCDVG